MWAKQWGKKTTIAPRETETTDQAAGARRAAAELSPRGALHPSAWVPVRLGPAEGSGLILVQKSNRAGGEGRTPRSHSV